MNRFKPAATAATVAAIAAAAAIPLGLAEARAFTGKTQTLRIFDQPVATTLTEPSGKVISRPPYPQPSAGDVLDVYSLEYTGNHLRHAKHWSMSAHLRCTFGTGQPDCESHVAIGGSLLIFRGNKLQGGTGYYQGATGRILSNHEVPGPGNRSDIVAQIHRGGEPARHRPVHLGR
jgi:hypothetical protein